MESKYTKNWLWQVRHLTDNEVLLLLDGELAPRKQRQAARHLEDCWGCRARRARIESAISGFMEHRETLAVTPPGSWSSFQWRMRAIATVPSTTDASLVPWFSSWKMAWIVLAAAGISAFVYLSATPAVSAKEVLGRAEQSDMRRISLARSPVVYQKLRVTLGSANESVVEIWSDRQNARLRQRETRAVYAGLAKIFSANQMDSKWPLSAAAYARWSKNTGEPRVSESALSDGSKAMVLDTVSQVPIATGSIIEARLVVRERDWHPVEEIVRVQGDTQVLEYSVKEVAFEILDLAKAGAGIFAEENDRIAKLPVTPALPVHLMPVPADLALPNEPDAAVLDTVEMQARFTLHRTGADLGEPIGISRLQNCTILVRGLTETVERKQNLIAALAVVPSLTVDIKAVQETETSEFGLPESRGNDSASPIRVAVQKLPIEELLKGVTGINAREVARMSNSAVNLADKTLAEAWALRRLEERYPAALVKDLPQAAQSLLEVMRADHLRALSSDIRQLELLMEPLRQLVSPVGQQAAAGDVFGNVKTMHALVHGLFAGESLSDSANDAAAKLLQLLKTLRSSDPTVAGLVGN